ncbi:limb region 1 protein homolog isoform X2 [Balaenoptera acutorostrata]|uniref:Limb region 1 protein homolog isoform X2 n=1 Tax=Balaenoptera acutorostrata TaxID=9767 RepID=A0ABM3TUU0_BALAC|nr:limb region 1 protein homolog isoform X2 [Balaenoptera acutorostrata]
MEGQDEVSAREQHFHSQVRESTICFLLFAILYIVSYFIITRYKRKSDEQEDEDAIVNRISLFLSTFTLAVSAGAVLLLPFSIISNEILLSFPQNYYIQWLNGSLIHGLWNLASLFSNLCLFVLMPFAFFFLESEGFAGLKKGIRARILETLVMLILLALLILGIVWVASALIDNDAASMESLYDLWEFYLPYLYSCISLMGCLLLLLCTPVGLSRMFTVMGQLLVKPTILEDLDEQIYIITLEEEALQRRLNGLSSSVEHNITELEQELDNVKTLKTKLERRKKASAWERNLVYPAVMVLLLIETSISVLLVACNILCLLIDETAMPKGTRGPGIGNASLSAFGFVGAALEIILIFYLMVSSVVGFYSLRFFGNFIPKKDDTTMTKIIGNCVSILVLSSALPVMSRTLGFEIRACCARASHLHVDWTATGGSWLPALDSVAWRLRKTLERSDLTSGHREVANPGPLDSSSVKRLKADVNAISSVLAERLWLFHGTGQDERNSAHQTSQSFRCVMRGTCSLWTWRTFPFQVSYSTGHPMCAVCLFICFYVDNLAGCHVSVSHLHQKVPSRTWCSLPIPIRPARRLEPAREGGSGCGE